MKGRTPEQAAQALKAMRATNPVTWLKHQVEKAKLPPDLKAHVDRLFRGHDRYFGVDPDTAREDAYRIGCRVNWARAQYALLRTEPTDPHYFTLSKVCSLWATNDLKFKTQRKMDTPEGKRKRRFPRGSESVRLTETDEMGETLDGLDEPAEGAL